MDMDEDDDFYSPEEPDVQPAQTATSGPPAAPNSATKAEAQNDELEEGEEEDEGGEMDEDDDSDIDIITERKDGSKPTPPTQSRYSEIRNIPQRSTANDATVKAPPIKKEEETKQAASGADLPPVSTSKVDINAVPVYPSAGKPITQVNIDEDLPDNDKPWRQPGTDISDYFNYGFDEFTWTLYAQKQESLRAEYNQDAITQNNKKMFEDMANMMMMGGMMPGLPGVPGSAAAGAGAAGAPGPVMPSMDGLPPEMQAMMQQMMAGGMDPSQMDPNAMAAMFAGIQNAGGAPGPGVQGGQGQNFGGGFGGNQGQGYGYDQQGMGGGRGNFGGGARGRGGRRNW